MLNNPFKSADWTESSLKEMWNIIRSTTKEEFGLDFYEPYFEIVTFEEMLQIYTTGFPVMFEHWSFGKDYEDLYKKYKYNRTSIAYEVIFNTNPALCYLLETNTSTMQAFVMSHAAIGHSAFFKNNEFLKENTNAKTILPFLKNMRSFVSECYRKYGQEKVEKLLDTCRSLSLYAIDRAEIVETTREMREQKKIKRMETEEREFDVMITDLVHEGKSALKMPKRLREENILRYIALHSPNLKEWERNLILMFCKVEQYFYPQMFTKLMNEGYASFWHYQLMNKLYDKGYLDDSNILEFIHSHAAVLCQRDHDQPGYGGLNPYKLGYEIFNDIKRICTEPTEEDKFYFPYLVGKNWVEEVNFAAANFKDESFILQYLSPKIVRDFKLFGYKNDSDRDYWEITDTHGDEDFKNVRANLSKSYNLFGNLPLIYVEGSDLKNTRTLFLVAQETKNLHVEPEGFGRALSLLKTIWPFPIKIKYITYSNEIVRGEIE